MARFTWRCWTSACALVSLVLVALKVGTLRQRPSGSFEDGAPQPQPAQPRRLHDNLRPFTQPWLSDMPRLPKEHAPDAAGWSNSFAVCAVFKDENVTDVREWLAFYRWLGADHVFLIDNNSTDGAALAAALRADFDLGFLTLRAEEHPQGQMRSYAWCAEEQRANFNWLMFLDLDEFLIVHDGRPLKQYLNSFKHEAGLAVHWIWVGPSGHAARPPQGGALPHYSRCSAEPAPQLKTLANTWHLRGLATHPHNFDFRDGLLPVNEDRRPIQPMWRPNPEYTARAGAPPNCTASTNHCLLSPGPAALPPVARTIAIYHYATKSLEDFAAKMLRGSSISKRARKDMSYFADIARKQSDAAWCQEPARAAEQCCAHLYKPGGNPLLSATAQQDTAAITQTGSIANTHR